MDFNDIKEDKKKKKHEHHEHRHEEPKNEVERELGIDDERIIHIETPPTGKPKDWSYRVESPVSVSKNINNRSKHQIENKEAHILKGLCPNPVYFDHCGISEYLPQKTFNYFIAIPGFKPYTEDK
jgi:hypothetical protein